MIDRDERIDFYVKKLYKCSEQTALEALQAFEMLADRDIEIEALRYNMDDLEHELKDRKAEIERLKEGNSLLPKTRETLFKNFLETESGSALKVARDEITKLKRRIGMIPEINIKEKNCPGCGKAMPAKRIDHTGRSLVHIRWGCDKCNRSFTFTYIQDSDELPEGGQSVRVEHYSK